MRNPLKHYAPKDLERLSANAAFQKAYAEDARLDELDRMAAMAEVDDKVELLTFFGGTWLLCGSMEIRPITAGVASLLWLIESPYVKSRETLNKDVDAALYVLDNRLEAMTGDVFKDSLGYCESKGLERLEVDQQIREAIKVCTSPFHIFPPAGEKTEVRFDVEWLASMVRRVHAVTGFSPDQIIWEESLLSVGYYLVEYHRGQGERMQKLPKKDILDEMFNRTYEMVDEWLAKGA